MDKNINIKLLKIAQDWKNKVFIPYFENDTDFGKCIDKKRNNKYKKENAYISCPFQLGLSESYIENLDNKSRLMIIGQEPRGFGVWHKHQNYPEYLPENLQKWAIEYLKKQLDKNYEPTIQDIHSNTSYFWNLIRKLSKDYAICCNDIDKVYYAKQIINTDQYEKQGTLTYEAERKLSIQYTLEGESKPKSLLEREIEYAHADILLFITGPSYTTSMEIAFGLNENSLVGKLNKNNHFIDITNIMNINKLAYWTYHPRYANRLHINIAELLHQNLAKSNK